MKIGILTFHDTKNYGSWLQTYGLYKKLEELGYNCEIIDYQCPSIVKRELPKKFNEFWNLKAMIKFIIFESFLKLSGIARYNIIPFVIATKSRNPIIPLAHISKPTSLTSLLTDTKRRKVGHNKTHKNT